MNITKILGSKILEVLGTPLAKLMQKELENEEWLKLVSHSINMDSEPDDIIACNLFKKLQDVVSQDVNPEQAALQAFLDAERTCAETNKRIRFGHSFPGKPILDRASEIIAKILGPFSIKEWKDSGTFGRRAAVGAHGKHANIFKHLSALSYNDEFGVLRSMIYDVTSLRGMSLTAAKGSEVAFVPKNVKTHRSICIEPSLNLYFQLGLGKMMQHRLKAIGIDISTQLNNQVYARIGSVSQEYATVDLSAASDTISTALIEYLFQAGSPTYLNDWYYAMFACRCSCSMLPDKTWIRNNKWSSMGNGFTFPLETLVFYSITKAVAENCHNNGKILVYGDDIICPSSIVNELYKALSDFGFTVNDTKSFHTGPYRESCGVHCWNGTLYRPIRLINYTAPNLRLLANTILAQAYEEGCGYFFNARWRDVYKYIIRLLPKEQRINTIVPTKSSPDLYQMDVSDVALVDPRAKSPALFRSRVYTQWDGLVFNVYRKAPSFLRCKSPRVALRYMLLQLETGASDGLTNNVVVGGVKGKSSISRAVVTSLVTDKPDELFIPRSFMLPEASWVSP